MIRSPFRAFVYDKWYEYKDEVRTWEKREVEGSPEDYFQKYKWCLKYKHKLYSLKCTQVISSN